MSGFRELSRQIGEIADLLAANALLGWDLRVMMPSGGAAARGEQMATLAQLAREKLLSAPLARALDGAEVETAALPADSFERRSIAALHTAIAHHRRLPDALVRARNVLKAAAQMAWAEARAADDFALFAPLLEETVVLARRQAEALGYDEHPFDALLAQFEPDMRWADLAPLFARLRREIGPLRRAVLDRPAPPSPPAGPYPIAAQQMFGREIAAWFGYDFTRGRLDPTLHPFETALNRGDVRITARYSETALAIGLKATMHEVGHGLYEQNVDPALTRTALGMDLIALSSGAGASLGVHESQSRLWENHVGRSLPFWRLAYPKLQTAFPVLGATPLEVFCRRFNTVERGAIRTEADELSYDFHILVRSELERALIEGSLSVTDLPAAWNAAIRRELGIDITGDREGVLQDIHWALGQFGSFCSYTVGNLLAAQFWDAVVDAPIAAAIEVGDFAPLRQVLTQKIYRHGRSLSPAELIAAATGRPLDAEPYIAYLDRKYRALYGL